MITTLRGKAGTVGVTLPVSEQSGLFLSLYIYLPSVIRGSCYVSETFLARLGMVVRVRGRHGVFGVDI